MLRRTCTARRRPTQVTGNPVFKEANATGSSYPERVEDIA